MNTMSEDELIARLEAIRNKGFIRTIRAHDTGVGQTLEQELGLTENNFALPDVGEIELKAKRIESGSMLTVATKTAQPRGANRALYNAYKYPDGNGTYVLHGTVRESSPNPRGFQLNVENDKLTILNPQKISAYYPLSIFDDVLVSKSNKVLLVFAKTRGERKTLREEFHYIEGYLAFGLNKEKFIEALKSDVVKIDIRIGTYRSGKKKGKYHDHGTAIRLFKEDILSLYDEYKQVL